ncbi:MAG: cytochrome C oxidase subunit IV family protein [Pyrinomonadaceae bacterium]|nr:cytochrome C oxidase subunit IV family protein [Pyrinomonadaceae bacterium]
MSRLFKSSNREEVILNLICLALAAVFIVIAVANINWAGNILTIDGLFMSVVMLMLAGFFLISPIYWGVTHGYIKMPFAAPEGGVVDSTPVHFEGSTKLFMAVLGYLLGLTLVEVFLAYIHTPLHIMLTILMGLSIMKAALIMAYFMHLRFERLSLVITLVPMLVVCICLFFVFFPDSTRSSTLRYKGSATAPTTSESK